MPEVIYVKQGNKFHVPRISCDLFNRKSKNMYIDNTSGIQYVSGLEKQISSDILLYAVWDVEDRELENTLGGKCEDCKGKTFFLKYGKRAKS